MESVLQMVAVALLVTARVVFAVWRLSPARLKLRLLDRLRPDTANVWGRHVAHLRKKAAAELMRGCSVCASTPTHIQNHKVSQKAGGTR